MKDQYIDLIHCPLSKRVDLFSWVDWFSHRCCTLTDTMSSWNQHTATPVTGLLSSCLHVISTQPPQSLACSPHVFMWSAHSRPSHWLALLMSSYDQHTAAPVTDWLSSCLPMISTRLPQSLTCSPRVFLWSAHGCPSHWLALHMSSYDQHTAAPITGLLSSCLPMINTRLPQSLACSPRVFLWSAQGCPSHWLALLMSSYDQHKAVPVTGLLSSCFPMISTRLPQSLACSPRVFLWSAHGCPSHWLALLVSSYDQHTAAPVTGLLSSCLPMISTRLPQSLACSPHVFLWSAHGCPSHWLALRVSSYDQHKAAPVTDWLSSCLPMISTRLPKSLTGSPHVFLWSAQGCPSHWLALLVSSYAQHKAVPVTDWLSSCLPMISARLPQSLFGSPRVFLWSTHGCPSHWLALLVSSYDQHKAAPVTGLLSSCLPMISTRLPQSLFGSPRVFLWSAHGCPSHCLALLMSSYDQHKAAPVTGLLSSCLPMLSTRLPQSLTGSPRVFLWSAQGCPSHWLALLMSSYDQQKAAPVTGLLSSCLPMISTRLPQSLTGSPHVFQWSAQGCPSHWYALLVFSYDQHTAAPVADWLSSCLPMISTRLPQSLACSPRVFIWSAQGCPSHWLALLVSSYDQHTAAQVTGLLSSCLPMISTRLPQSLACSPRVFLWSAHGCASHWLALLIRTDGQLQDKTICRAVYATRLRATGG